MIKYSEIKENTIYSYYTSKEKMYYFFEYRDKYTVWITSFDYRTTEFLYEKFWEYSHKFDNSVYAQGFECKDINNLIKCLFDNKVKWLS